METNVEQPQMVKLQQVFDLRTLVIFSETEFKV
jgi:hypothetical protein